MEYKKFIELEWNSSKAYILGLLFTRIDIGFVPESNKKYLIGQVAHNSNKVTDDDIVAHLMNLADLLLIDSINVNNVTISKDDIKVVYDNVEKGRKSGKTGFVVALELEGLNNDNLNETKNQINQDLMVLVKEIPDKFIKYLIAGTIDGRSSYDTTIGYVSIDIDRDYTKQELIKKTMQRLNIDVNINARKKGHLKADQLRYKPSDIKMILAQIPLMSVVRINMLKVV